MKAFLTVTSLLVASIFFATESGAAVSAEEPDWGDTIAVDIEDSPVKAHWYNIPAAYSPELATLKIPATSPCNSAPGEKFSAFIKRFNSDAAFRALRCRPSEAQTESDLIMPFTDVLQTAVKVLAKQGFIPFYGRAVGKDEFGQPLKMGAWYDIEHDSVIYSTWLNGGTEETYLGSAVILFERIEGKWYFADCYPFGNLYDAILEALK